MGWSAANELTDSNLERLQVQVFPATTLPGGSVWPAGEKMETRNLQIQLESHMYPDYWGTFANTKADGTFFLADVMQGIYDLRVSGFPDGYYFRSAMLGNLDVTDGLKIGEGTITEPLVVRVSPSGAQLEGLVTTNGGKPACTAAVVLIPEGSRHLNRFLYEESDVDRFGHYVFNGIAPGDYKLFAFDHAGVVPYFDSTALSTYENQGQAVHFEAGDRRTVALRVILTRSGGP